ncbi:glutamate receptor 2.8-like isoform X1 [Macadamia integrifolia]|uniref:glutamate receptor 2.8-like isoform X1 n=1 Tax=Macadamia integrifolia TaxID=60698 RepID=UPI001C52DA5B|nr:glutamate receptor 2.8-like isoform X1 [Macadamia integrifolia]
MSKIDDGTSTLLKLDNWHPHGDLSSTYGYILWFDLELNRMALISSITWEGTWRYDLVHSLMLQRLGELFMKFEGRLGLGDLVMWTASDSGEKIVNNLTRVVMITWVFFVLILTQSYTASLSSILTVKQLQPTIKDVNDITNNGYYVGHQDDSFVKDFLTDHLNLNESKLKSYGTLEEYHSALSAGTHNGGVAAIFMEVPYIKVFLSMYCNKYTTVGLIYSSEGFGVVSLSPSFSLIYFLVKLFLAS